MKPGIFGKAAIAAAVMACAAALAPAGTLAQESNTNRWQLHQQQPDVIRRSGGEGRRMQGTIRRESPRLNRAERRIRSSEGRRFRQDPVVRQERRAQRSKQRHEFRYNHRRHGKRYRHRRPGFVHFHDGFWYSTPFWTYGYDYDYVPAYGVSDWDLHVAWCHRRYRSYREDLDAFKGYDGKWHRCISPYSY